MVSLQKQPKQGSQLGHKESFICKRRSRFIFTKSETLIPSGREREGRSEVRWEKEVGWEREGGRGGRKGGGVGKRTLKSQKITVE